MIDLYTWTTGNGRKIPIMLEETGLPYRIHWVNLRKREQFDPEYLKLNPNNKIPTIIDQDGPDHRPLTVFESGAILVYLGRKSGMFYPDDPAQQAHVLQWLFFQIGHVGPTFGQVGHFRTKFGTADDYGKERFLKETVRIYNVIEKRLAEVDFLAGDYSIADIATYPWVRNYKNQGQDISTYPNTRLWMERVESRPAVGRANRLIDQKRKEAEAAAS